VLGVSPSTVQRDWRAAQAWLNQALGEPTDLSADASGEGSTASD
jgi:hypothetical protein